MVPDVTQDVWTWNGTVPGPNLRAHVVDVFDITVVSHADMDDSRDVHGASKPPFRSGTTPVRPPLAVGEGRGVVFVSDVGEVGPSGFLPFVVGNVRETPLTTIYRDGELFRTLRDPDRLKGRWGGCECRSMCSGSRAQASATGGPLAEAPGCPYVR